LSRIGLLFPVNHAPVEGKKYFEPSLARTASGNFIPARTLMMDNYCLNCHKDAYQGWFHSAHRFSSFNNKPYLFSVRETRQVALKRDGNVKAARWCAGCHDVAPFFSGAFDDPNFDDVNHPTSQRHHLYCLSCHHARQQHERQRGLYHRRANPLSVRLQHQSLAAIRQPAIGESETGVSQKDIPQAVPQGRGILFHLPQGQSSAGAGASWTFFKKSRLEFLLSRSRMPDL
jgi:hypothetical protein